MDVEELKRSWDLVIRRGGDQLASRFYSYLFILYPDTRALFPLSMAAQRDRFVSALGYTVSRVDELDTLAPFLEQLGRDHRKFGVSPEHYPQVGRSLMYTIAETHGDSWTSELADGWSDAFGMVAKVMIDAAASAAGEGVPAS